MPFDLDFLDVYCRELGSRCNRSSPDELAIDLGHGVELCFVNAADEKDCLMHLGTSWHKHGPPFLFGGGGYSVEFDELGLLGALESGELLIFEHWSGSQLIERSLIHRDHNDAFGHAEPTDEFRVYRANLDSEVNRG